MVFSKLDDYSLHVYIFNQTYMSIDDIELLVSVYLMKGLRKFVCSSFVDIICLIQF